MTADGAQPRIRIRRARRRALCIICRTRINIGTLIALLPNCGSCHAWCIIDLRRLEKDDLRRLINGTTTDFPATGGAATQPERTEP